MTKEIEKNFVKSREYYQVEGIFKKCFMDKPKGLISESIFEGDFNVN